MIQLISLPIEILAHISLFLNSRHDAASLSYTCKALHPVGQNRMYRVGGSQHLLCNWAIKTGDVELFRRVLAAGKVRGDMKMLCFACKYGHIDIVDELIKIDVVYEKLINFPNHGKVHPLYHASRYGHVDVMRRLLALPNANPNKFNGVRRKTALDAAALQTNPDVVRLLFESGAVLHFDDNRQPPLFVAVSYGHTAVAEELLEAERRARSRPADWDELIYSFLRFTNTGNKQGVDSFILDHLAPCAPGRVLTAAAIQCRMHIIETMVQQNPSPLHPVASTILRELYPSIFYSDWAVHVCRLLVEHGAIVTETGNPTLPTPTHYAVAANNLRAAEYFYHKELDTGPPHTHYVGLLNRADSVSMFEFLFQESRDLDTADDQGYTPLLYKIKNWNRYRQDGRTFLDAVKMFLQNGSDPNFVGPAGETPLSLAVTERCASIAPSLVKLLTDYGAELKDPTNAIEQDYYPMNFLQILVGTYRHQTAELLLDHGGKLYYTDRQGWTPIMHAAYCRDIDLLRLLINRGADVFEKDEKQRTLLAILSTSYENWLRPQASLNETIACIQLLIDMGVDFEEPDINGQKPIDLTENGYEKEFYLRHKKELMEREEDC